MANSFIGRSSRNAICPICGYPGNDYCGRQLTEDGELIVCMRTAKGLNYFNEDGSCNGYDGQYYVRVGTSRSGNACFMEAKAKLASDIRKGIVKKPKNFVMPAYEPPKPKVVVDEVKPLSNKELHKIYSLMAKHLKLEDYHRKYLHDEGWTDEMIEKYQVVSFPEKDFTRFKYRAELRVKCPYRSKLATMILEDLGNPQNGLRGVPGAYRTEQGKWTFAGPSGIIFWQKDIEGNIYRARIRMDYLDYPGYTDPDEFGRRCFYEKGHTWFLSPMKGAYRELPDGSTEWNKEGQFNGKYRNLSSYAEDEKELQNNRIVNTYNSGCQSGNNLGYYYNRERDDMHICYITEGEKKGAFANHVLKAPFISLPGVSSWSLLFNGEKGNRPVDKLRDMGIRYFVMAYDADKSVNAAVLEKERQTVEALKKEGIFIGVAEWDIKHGKGLDDLLAAGYKPQYSVY